MNAAAPRETRSTCPYCGVGCGVIIETSGAQITGVRGDPDHPANRGRLCTKGSTLHLTASPAAERHARLLQPMQRLQRGGAVETIGWDAALDLAAQRVGDVVETHGPDAVGFYVSGQLLTEDYYVFNKLAKGLVGTNNIDTNSRLCMSSAVAGYKMTLGADAPPACYDDIDVAGALFIAGSNTAWAHPILYRRIEDARRANPALKTIVVDPRRTETAEAADLHLQIVPGSDVALFNGMLHVMLWEGLIDAAYIERHTSGFDALKARVRDDVPTEVARRCGIEVDALVQAARWFALGGEGRMTGARRPTLSLYCQGLNQSVQGSANNAALINLHLATGQIGRAGAGPLSLTGQPNAMGGREVGGLANLLSAHRDLANPAHRAEVARLWGVDRVPAAPGKTAVEMFEAAADGEIKALWIACTNPAQSMPNQAVVRRALERAEFVIVQEAYATTATAAYADLLLPAASWGEKDGTVTNSERRISRVQAAVPAPGQARADWAIAADVARRLEARLRPARPTLFPYADAEAVWNEHRESTRGRDLDITGLSYASLAAAPAQWPCPEGAEVGQARLYEDGRYPTADGRARFVEVVPAEPAEEPDARRPFMLNTGRLRDQWHGMSRTGTVARLFGHAPEPVVEMNAADMQRLGIADGEPVRLASRRGTLVLPAQASAAQAPSQAFVAMHWGGEYLSGHDEQGRVVAGINMLTTDAYCAQSKQPALKHAAIGIRKAALPWRLVGMGWFGDDAEAHTAETRLRALMPRLPFAACVPFGRERRGLLFRAAAAAPADDALLDDVAAAFGLCGAAALSYVDRPRGQRRSMRLVEKDGDARLEACLLAGTTDAEAWIRPLLQEELPARAYGRALLMPGMRPPIATVSRGRQICSCFNVGEREIDATLAATAGSDESRLAALQQALRCGTQCGSCKPELMRRVRLQGQAA